MQTLSNENQLALKTYLAGDRQWKRECRIGYARRMLMLAWALTEQMDQQENVAFWRAVIKANEI